jgi:PAS domain S-box-containing protein
MHILRLRPHVHTKARGGVKAAPLFCETAQLARSMKAHMLDSPVRKLPCVVVMLSDDTQLQEQLPRLLTQLDASVEVQVTDSLANLKKHLRNLRPDAVIFDTQCASLDDLSGLLKEPWTRHAPSLALAGMNDAPNDQQRQALLDQGLTDYIWRTEGYLAALGEAVLISSRMARLSGQMAEQERHYRYILDALQAGVFVCRHGLLTYVNRSLSEAFGPDIMATLGKVPLVDCLVEGEREAVAQLLAHVEITDGEPHVFEVNLLRGKQFEVTCHASVADGGRSVVGIMRDVTLARRTQAELETTRQRAAQVERLRALGELAAGVAHDFNNSLGTILGRVALARLKLKTGERLEDELDVIELAGRHAASTVRRVLEFSRPNTNDTWCDLDLADVVRESAALLATQAPNGVRFVTDIQAVPAVRGNRNELREVLLNLVRNAFDAVPEGGRVNLSCSTFEGRALIEVRDDGHGMTEDVKRNIFLPFFSTKAARGTGLGLSVSHWILRRHDAQIAVESAPDQGTQFRIVFEGCKPALKDAPPLTKQTLNILLVEDDSTVGEMMRDLLQQQGHEVTVVGTATKALEILPTHGCDLVITDLDLPDMGGWQLARQVRAQRQDLMVGLVSGWPIGPSQEELKARGISFVLSKPFSTDMLNQALSKARVGVG